MHSYLKFKSWSDAPYVTKNFKLVSKYTDLGTPDTKKSILGFILNLNISSTSSVSDMTMFKFLIDYRTSSTSAFKTLTQFNNSYMTPTSNESSVEFIQMLTYPLRGIINLQLRIKAAYLKNDIGINDIGLIFRKHRDSTVVTFDE